MKGNKYLYSVTQALLIVVLLWSCDSSDQHKSQEESVTEQSSTEMDTIVGIDKEGKPEAPHVQKSLIISIDNLASDKAPIMVAFYKSDKHFLHKKGRIKEYKFTPSGKTLTVSIGDVEYGEYAIGIYQDMNDNGRMDRNALGLPAEGYAFSNNFKPKLRVPSYKDCKFDYDDKNYEVKTSLIK